MNRSLALLQLASVQRAEGRLVQDQVLNGQGLGQNACRFISGGEVCCSTRYKGKDILGNPSIAYSALKTCSPPHVFYCPP